MTKKISIATILLIGWFFCIGSNMAIAKEYTSVEDIQLDGEDAIGKRATLCIRKWSIGDDSDGKYVYAAEAEIISSRATTSRLYIYFDKNQKELIKKIGEDLCTMVTIKIFRVGGTAPSGRLISVGK